MYRDARQRYYGNMPTRAIIYCRQSRERDDSTSIEDQEDVARRFCAANDWSVVDVVVDRDTSGSEMPWRQRRNFPTVFDIDCDVLVLYRWDRLSRNGFDQEEILKKWGALGRDMQAATEPIDAATSAGVLNRDIIMMFARHQARVIGERWRETLARRVERGLPKNGLDRMGYIKESGAYVVDPETGPALRDAYLRYTKGADLTSIAKPLGVKGGSLGRILDSGFGAGKIVHMKDGKRSFTDGAHEPVITADEWQAFLDKREGRRAAPPKQRSPQWYLAGIVCCATCGYRMHARTTSLICGTYKNKGKDACPGTFIKRATVEQAVTNWIGANIDAFPERDDADAPEANVVPDLESRLDGVLARLARLAEGWASGLLDDEGYRGAQALAQAERTEVEGLLRAARDEAARARPLTQDEWSRLETGDASTVGEWNALLGRVIRRVEVHAAEKGEPRLVIVPVIGEPTPIFDSKVERREVVEHFALGLG